MIVPEGYGQVRFRFAVSGVADVMGFGLGFLVDSLTNATEMCQIADDAFIDAFLPSNAAMMAGWTYLGTEGFITRSGEPELGAQPEAISGTGGFDAPTINTAILVRKNTPLGGRKNRGRMFVPPFNVGQQQVDQSGTLEPTLVTNLQTAWSGFRSVVQTATIEPTLFHSHPDDAPTHITSFAVQGLAATQRRRMR